MTRTRRLHLGDGGAASLLVVAGVAVLLLGFAGAVVVADLVATDTRARTAADLAVLAAAAAAVEGPQVACARAGAVAADNRARLERCRPGGDGTPFDIDVVVSAEARGPAAAIARYLGVGPVLLRARARAGPARG